MKRINLCDIRLFISVFIITLMLFTAAAYSEEEITPIVMGEQFSSDMEPLVKLTRSGNAKASYTIRSIALKLNGSATGAFLTTGSNCKIILSISISGASPGYKIIEDLSMTTDNPGVFSAYYYTNDLQKGIFLRAEKPGQATLTVEVRNKKDTILVCVADSFETGVNLSSKVVELKAGSSKALMAMINGKNGNKPQKVKWSSNNKTIATVSSKGVVKARAAGSVVITGTKGGQSAQCNVTVYSGSVPTPTPTPGPDNTPAPRQDQFAYKISGQGIEITGLNTKDYIPRELVIPAKIDGYDVVSIGHEAFYNCDELTRVRIMYGLTSIGSEAFALCSSLTDVVIPNSVTSIGHSAFRSTKLRSVSIPNSISSIADSTFWFCTSLTDVVIPDSVTSIGNLAFSCTDLESISIPNSVTSIGYSAFESTDLKSVSIPNSVTSISNATFMWCRNLTSVEIPNSVTSIGENAFSDCPKLTVKCSRNSYAWNYCVENGIPTQDDSDVEYEFVVSDGEIKILKYTSNARGQLTIPSEINGYPVTSIGDMAFSDCDKLTGIVIPNGVTSIGDKAFFHCTGLTDITIPGSVRSIGICALANCSSLTSVRIPSGLTVISDSMLYNCNALSSVIIPNSVTKIGVSALEACSSLESIVLPKNITSIEDEAFSFCAKLYSITIPAGVTSIGNEVFSYCGNLYSIAIPNDVTSIGDRAFLYCYTLKSMVIPEGATSIGAEAFKGCRDLESVTIPDSVNSIGYKAFSYCDVVTVKCPESSYAWNYCIENGIPVKAK